MKKHILPAIALLVSLLTAQAQVFSPNNLVVVDQTITPTTGSGITLYQFTTSGSQVSTLALPSSGVNSFIISTGTTEGFVTLSANSNYLVLAGYAAQPGSTPQSATSAVAPRAAATVDAYGNFALPVKNPNIYSTFNCRGAASDGLGNFWLSGSGGTGGNITNGEIGIVYATSAANFTVTETGTGNERCLDIYNGNLYLSTGASSHGIFVISNVSGTYPQTTVSPASANAGSIVAMPLASSSSSPYAFQINAGGTVAYVAEAALGGIIKFTAAGTGPYETWTSNYTLSVLTAGTGASFSNAFGCAVDWSQSPPVIYATTSETTTNRLVKIVDTGAGATATLLATAPASTAFRGVRFGPQAYPYFSVPPAPFVGNPGATATFSATVLGSPTPTLQWYSNSVAAPTYVAIPGATTATLTLPGITQAQSGSLFYLRAVNAFGTTTNPAVSLTVNNPAISGEPTGATNLLGGSSVNLSVTASGTGTLTYQWFANGVLIGGATGANYTVASGGSPSSVTYTVVVTNTVGATSTTATSTAAVVSYTQYLLHDTFTYANGNLFGDAGSPWTDINGTNPELVSSGRVVVDQANATTDAQSLFIQSVPNTAGSVVYASFIINLTTLPTNGGVYFANLEGATDFQFVGCVYALTANAYPGTYRLGIACTNLDYNPTTGRGGPTAVIPVDLAPGIDYQVVFAYDMSADLTYLGINPDVTVDTSTTAFESDGNVVYSTDSQAFTNDIAAFGLRQRAGMGTMQLDNLEVSLDTASITGILAVTAGITPVAPTIGFQPIGFTNYTGATATMEVAASAIGSGINLSYAWYKNTIASPGTYTQVHDGGDVTGSATAEISFSDLAAGDSGTYYAIASDSTGNSPQSANAIVSVNTTPTAPFFVSPPTPMSTTNLAATIYGSVTMTALAEGSGPISYQWNFYNGSSTTSVGTGPSLTLSSLAINQSGTYTVVASGTQSPAATSPNYVLTVSPPAPVTIAYLRSLLVTTAAPTITLSSSPAATAEYSVTGVITVATNVTTSSYASYYVQDATGGIDFFVQDSTFRPMMGDIVTVIGTLSLFDDNLELDTTVGNPSETYTVTGGSLTPLGSLPVATVTLPVGYPQASPALTSQYYEGEMITLTNVYFTSSGTFAALTDYALTNQGGVSVGISVYSDEGTGTPDTTIVGQSIPRFAYSITGALDQYSTGTYEINVTRYSDIVTTPPPAPGNFTAVLSGPSNNHVTLTWTASPKYAYSVLSASNVAGPYTTLSSGMTFTTSAGTYTDINPPATGARFYVIVSP